MTITLNRSFSSGKMLLTNDTSTARPNGLSLTGKTGGLTRMQSHGPFALAIVGGILLGLTACAPLSTTGNTANQRGVIDRGPTVSESRAQNEARRNRRANRESDVIVTPYPSTSRSDTPSRPRTRDDRDDRDFRDDRDDRDFRDDRDDRADGREDRAASQPRRAAPRPEQQTPRSNTAVLALLKNANKQSSSGKLDSAAAALERALRIEPRNAEIWHRLASVRLKQGQYGQAASLAAKSNNLAGNNPGLVERNRQIITAANRR